MLLNHGQGTIASPEAVLNAILFMKKVQHHYGMGIDLNGSPGEFTSKWWQDQIFSKDLFLQPAIPVNGDEESLLGQIFIR
jgi:hypothetical protein